MGDFAFSDLTREGGLYPHLADEPCAGCGEALGADARCYCDFMHIWHSGCWPRVGSHYVAPSLARVEALIQLSPS